MCLLDPHMCLGCMEVGSLRTGWVQGAGLIPRMGIIGGAAKAKGLVQMSQGHPSLPHRWHGPLDRGIPPQGSEPQAPPLPS